jgi:hypothetical protein
MDDYRATYTSAATEWAYVGWCLMMVPIINQSAVDVECGEQKITRN